SRPVKRTRSATPMSAVSFARCGRLGPDPATVRRASGCAAATTANARIAVSISYIGSRFRVTIRCGVAGREIAGWNVSRLTIFGTTVDATPYLANTAARKPDGTIALSAHASVERTHRNWREKNAS